MGGFFIQRLHFSPSLTELCAVRCGTFSRHSSIVAVCRGKGDGTFGRQVRCVCHHIIVLLSFANKKATPFGMANH
jgi:hypothetical protein